MCVCLFGFHVGFKLEDEKCLNLFVSIRIKQVSVQMQCMLLFSAG